LRKNKEAREEESQKRVLHDFSGHDCHLPIKDAPAGVASGYDGSLVCLQSPQGMIVGLIYLKSTSFGLLP
jgi:septum formation inhibitor-activating ATPase MinD